MLAKSTQISTPFSRAFQSELAKGHHSAPLILAILMPLPLALPGFALSLMGSTGMNRTIMWNYWYSSLMPISICLISVSTALWEKKFALRSILGLPVNVRTIFYAKTLYVWMLCLISNFEIGILSSIAFLLGADSPNIADSMASALLITVMSAWLAPAVIALTTAWNSLLGIVLPFLLNLALYVGLWSSSVWWILPSSAIGRVVQPLLHILPSGEPIEVGFAVAFWQQSTAILIAIILAIVLTAACAHWYSKQEAK